LVHNHDTSIKTFAKLLNDKIKKIPNVTGYDELDLCERDIVSITRKSLSDDLERLITSLNNKSDNPMELLPQIIVAQSNAIDPSSFGRNVKKFQMQDIITIVNVEDETDKLTLAGQMFTYETPVQIVVLTRSQYASKEIALHTLNILANNERINYKVLLQDKETGQNHVLHDYGHIRLVGVKSASFSESSVQESGIVALAIDFKIREQFFMLRDGVDVMKKYIVRFDIENHHK